ncbi:MAG: hypothetical protein REI78_06865 [Pedobacter sp.]|nr:hypothetical protein [Pedobacter sp.]MDQ8052728.1 hypothetical protein [Pedobacter sp.]
MRILIICLGIFLITSCKKDASDNLTKYNWVLESEVVSPAMTINGTTSTDYMLLRGPESCAKNYTIAFAKNGSFTVSSTGSLCDMKANTADQQWTRGGDQLSLNFGKSVTSMTILEDALVSKMTIVFNGTPFVVTSTYRAKSK